MKLNKFAFIPFALFVAACGGGGSSVDLNGKTPEDQSAAVADLICDAEVECGQLNLAFGTDPETQATTCEATFEDGDYDACYADVQPDALDTFSNCDLTDDEINTIEECLNAQAAMSCITQAQADDYCQQFVDGVEDPVIEGHEVPASCEEMQAIIEACGTPA